MEEMLIVPKREFAPWVKLNPVSRALHRGTAGTADDDDAPKTDLVSSAFDKWMRRMVKVALKTEGGTPIGRTPAKTTVSKGIGRT